MRNGYALGELVVKATPLLLIALGTWAAPHPLIAVLLCFAVGALVSFLGLLSDLVAAGQRSTLMVFVLAVSMPVGPLTDRLLGWLLALLVCVPAALFLFPPRYTTELRHLAALVCAALADRIEAGTYAVAAAMAGGEVRLTNTRADLIVTPMNDSFVDFDLIGQVDAENFKVRKLSFYAELIWEARKERAKTDGVTIDWIVVRNRLHNMEARNQQRMTNAIAELSKRVGFRSVPGLNERVIYRELFPSGLTLIDKGHLGQLATAHIVARQELRELVTGLALPEVGQLALA